MLTPPMSKQPEKEEIISNLDDMCKDGCKHSASPTLEDKIAVVPSGRIDYCCECKTDHGYDCPKDVAATWEDKEREAFISKFTVWNDRYKYATLQGNEEYPTPDMIADYWLGRLRSAREEAYHQGGHDMDLKVSENFNRALKDESSELVKIIKEEGFKAGIKNAECQCAVHVELARAAAFKEASQYKNDKLLQEVQDAHEAGRESALEEIIPKIFKLKDCQYAIAYDKAIDELLETLKGK